MPETFKRATARYHDWLRRHCELDQAGLKKKRHEMLQSPFALLRGSFYRWPAYWDALDGPVRNARKILSVGDVHLENFGTWRDGEGRLAWGVNDFDEAARLPFTSDLVRLATSLRLEARRGLHLPESAAIDQVLRGYTTRLAERPRPFILEERHGWLRDIANVRGKAAEAYWDKLLADEKAPRSDGRRAAFDLLKRSLPKGVTNLVCRQRRSGLGSLGRPRFTAIGEWRGGLIAREAKAQAPSAARMSDRRVDDPARDCRKILRAAYRAEDPFLALHPGWTVRRLSPGSRKVEVDEIERVKALPRLMAAMGAELANIHLGTARRIGRIRDELRALPAGWLHEASDRISACVLDDHAELVGSEGRRRGRAR